MSGSHNQRLAALRRRRVQQQQRERELTADLQGAIRAARADGMQVVEIARRVGMSKQAVHRLYLHD